MKKNKPKRKTPLEAVDLANPPDREFLLVKEAATAVPCAEITIRKMLDRKQLTRYKFLAKTLVKKSELLSLIRPAE